MSLTVVPTRGHDENEVEGQRENNSASAPGPAASAPGLSASAPGLSASAPGPSASLKFSKLAQNFRKQLHKCFHSKKDQFTQFAIGFGFSENEIFFLNIIIESEYAEQCILCGGGDNNNNDAAKKQKYKNIEKQNIDKIAAHFNEVIDFVRQYEELIKDQYTEQSQIHFDEGNTSNLEIKLDPIIIKEQMAKLFDKSYEIIDSDEPDPPLIGLLNGQADNLLVQILDEKGQINDKYEITINNKKHNTYTNDDNKQQCIELNDILPLKKYSISVRRYNSEKKRWSKHCNPANIVTDFKCLWSNDLHGLNARLTNSCRHVYCKSNKGSCTIFGDIRYILSAAYFKEVTFSFTMHELAQFSYFGFIEYPMDVDEFKTNVGSYFDNGLIVKHSNSYCLGCCNGSAGVQRWINGSKKGIKKNFHNKDLKLPNGDEIKNGDVFLFHVNFDEMTCTVYVNQKSTQNIISEEMNGNTFWNIPQNILPAYSHENNSYVIANSKVSISVQNYILR